jgi:hypothetical protein
MSMSMMGGASPHPSRPPLMTNAMGVPTIDEESMTSMTSPAVEKDDPLDRMEHRGSDAMPLEPLPQGPGQGYGPGQGQGQGQERPRLQETESCMPLLSRTPSGRIRRESGMSPFALPFIYLCSIAPTPNLFNTVSKTIN